MATKQPKSAFLPELAELIEEHCAVVEITFALLTDSQLNWQPAPKEWSILQCFEHLNLTHDYYMMRIEQALTAPIPVSRGQDFYKPSFWGRIYMFFALNPKYSFPSPEEIKPNKINLDKTVLETYLQKQDTLQMAFKRVTEVDLIKTSIPIEKWVKFNLGDCLKILAYHDELHIKQAKGVLYSLQQTTN